MLPRLLCFVFVTLVAVVSGVIQTRQGSVVVTQPLKVDGVPGDSELCTFGCDTSTGWKFIDGVPAPEEPFINSVLVSAGDQVISIHGEHFVSPAIATFRSPSTNTPFSFVCIVESEKELLCSGANIGLITSTMAFSATTFAGSPIFSSTKYAALAVMTYTWAVQGAWIGDVFTNFTIPINGTITNIRLNHISGTMNGTPGAYASSYGVFIVARHYSRDLADVVLPFNLAKLWVYPLVPPITTDDVSIRKMMNVDMTANGLQVEQGELHTFGNIEDYYNYSEGDNYPGTSNLELTYTIVPTIM
eukprot:TRINITY_DN5936_c0_g1_i1.p1 TRINITY_DN5936_c0_g1~~TRINITY_DN5936_c0_g1_i1.p1  ORF type:complete len:340 (+),score=13.86 TRINITY_DN5936_c0_g1_i1:117-1022(+)